MIIHREVRINQKEQNALVPIDRIDFAILVRSVYISNLRESELFVDPFFNITFIRSADEIFGCFISYFRALWHFSILPRWPSPTFLLRERRNYSYVLPRYFPLCPDIVYPPQYNHPGDKQIPSLPYDHIERYAPLPRKWINFILGCGGRSSLL